MHCCVLHILTNHFSPLCHQGTQRHILISSLSAVRSSLGGVKDYEILYFIDSCKDSANKP